MARGLVPTAGPWVSLPSDALQHLQQHIYCSLAGSNAEQQQWGLNVVNLLTGTARSDFMQEGWEQVVGALLQVRIPGFVMQMRTCACHEIAVWMAVQC